MENKNKPNQNVALLIDGDSARDLQTIIKAYEVANSYGRVIYAALYIEEKDISLISTISNELSRRAIDVKVTIGPSEISMALDATELAYEGKIKYMVICTRRDTLIPVFSEIKRHELTTILLAPVSAPISLKDIADKTEVI